LIDRDHIVPYKDSPSFDLLGVIRSGVSSFGILYSNLPLFTLDWVPVNVKYDALDFKLEVAEWHVWHVAQRCKDARFYGSWTNVRDDLELVTHVDPSFEKWRELEFSTPNWTRRILRCVITS
jgi:hypothetical protein